MFVKPGPNTFEPEIHGPLLKPRDPVTLRRIPPEGVEAPETFAWLRLLRDGDVVLATPEPTPTPVEPAAT